MKVISTACSLLHKGRWYDYGVPSDVNPGDETDVLASEGVVPVDDSTPSSPVPIPDLPPATEALNEKE